MFAVDDAERYAYKCPMNRRQFVESKGATCDNWNWCWSFINEAKRTVIFGAWDTNTKGNSAMILDQDWHTNDDGRRNPGYSKSLEHIRLIEQEGYRLMTFPMEEARTAGGKIKIKRIIPVLSLKKLDKRGNRWWAIESDEAAVEPLAEELTELEEFVEGAQIKVTINAYERNMKARAACIAHHGCKCAVCGFDFVEAFGLLGEGFIHVHHLKPIGQIGRKYRIDPINDLKPVCPNCHAMIHRAKPALTIQRLRNHLRRKN
jgi:5-methylcytosine-specific restriction protein A